MEDVCVNMWENRWAPDLQRARVFASSHQIKSFSLSMQVSAAAAAAVPNKLWANWNLVSDKTSRKLHSWICELANARHRQWFAGALVM